MTVNTIDITSGPYAGNDVTTNFSYDFRVEDKTQLIVYETDDLGVQTILTVDVDYTVAGIGIDGGGTITRVAGALPTNYEWYIRSNYSATQDTDFDSQGGFFPDVHEAALDKLTFLHQQQQDQIDRSFKLSDGFSGSVSAELPEPSPLNFVRWNAAGTALENTIGTITAPASEIILTPTGDISSTNVQAAIAELDTEKEPADATILKDADIGTTVQAYDATIVVDADIGTTVQAYDADTAKLDVAQSWTAAQRGNTNVDLTNTGNVVLDFATYQNHVLTLTGNVTLDNPTTEVVGQSGFIIFIQDATGSRTVSLGTQYDTVGAAGLTLSTAANAIDLVPYAVKADGEILLGTPQLGFS